MLVEISKSTLCDTDKINASLLRDWCAIDTESGAYLKQTSGRGKCGLPKFFVILPHKSPAERGGFFKNTVSGGFERTTIRAWTLQEAIKIGNERLPKLTKRASGRN